MISSTLVIGGATDSPLEVHGCLIIENSSLSVSVDNSNPIDGEVFVPIIRGSTCMVGSWADVMTTVTNPSSCAQVTDEAFVERRGVLGVVFNLQGCDSDSVPTINPTMANATWLVALFMILLSRE